MTSLSAVQAADAFLVAEALGHSPLCELTFNWRLPLPFFF